MCVWVCVCVGGEDKFGEDKADLNPYENSQTWLIMTFQRTLYSHLNKINYIIMQQVKTEIHRQQA